MLPLFITIVVTDVVAVSVVSAAAIAIAISAIRQQRCHQQQQ